MESMKRVGLTGGIGSGKSTVAKLLREQGIPVVDADQVAREIVEPGMPALRQLAEEFGPGILSENGELKRAELARLAFASQEDTERLNSITHPAIEKEVHRQFQQLERDGHRVAVYDMPLLVEKNLHKEMDFTIVVDVDPEERVRRLVEFRGVDEEDARNRIARQIDDEVRRQAADAIIDNNGPESALKDQVASVADKIKGLS